MLTQSSGHRLVLHSGHGTAKRVKDNTYVDSEATGEMLQNSQRGLSQSSGLKDVSIDKVMQIYNSKS